MIGKAIAGWLGNRIDRRDGEGGTLGALAGVAVWEVGKRVVPAALVLGGIAYAVHRFSREEVQA
ncbi:hypothetical protein Q9Q95_02155 [Sphingomonas sp. DG1-23]|uniref:hypothetical protein n=1 Tax=Sphingomonas sp. DG1-23 TaxID=3068316 RepID=UPI0027401840|nr:hypothetical protein [Sphingomonas sp. DG1-23]MDP5277714.1 hypothetical protein [Sphingomonas sp. DG1-23]